jgi:hypothetical protein
LFFPFGITNRFVDAGFSLLAIGIALAAVTYFIAMIVGGFRARRAFVCER